MTQPPGFMATMLLTKFTLTEFTPMFTKRIRLLKMTAESICTCPAESEEWENFISQIAFRAAFGGSAVLVSFGSQKADQMAESGLASLTKDEKTVLFPKVEVSRLMVPLKLRGEFKSTNAVPLTVFISPGGVKLARGSLLVM